MECLTEGGVDGGVLTSDALQRAEAPCLVNSCPEKVEVDSTVVRSYSNNGYMKSQVHFFALTFNLVFPQSHVRSGCPDELRA